MSNVEDFGNIVIVGCQGEKAAAVLPEKWEANEYLGKYPCAGPVILVQPFPCDKSDNNNNNLM